jgi:endogenous inhibitor of DNA gyrase (YacG/DUF329 family)
MIDLNRWFEGEYCISDPLVADPQQEDDSPDRPARHSQVDEADDD